MPDHVSNEALDYLRHTYHDGAREAKNGGKVYAPVKNLEDTAKALDELAERRGREAKIPCKACGEPARGRYCPGHG
jgi:hypothetical protein